MKPSGAIGQIRGWMLAFVVGLALVAWPGDAAAQSEKALRHYVEGIRAYHRNDPKRTLSAFEAALKADPGNAEIRDVMAKVFQEYAYAAHREGDDVRSAQLLKRGSELAQTGETRLSLRRDFLRVSYLRIAARVKAGDLYSARQDEADLWDRSQQWLAADDSTYLVIRRLHEIIGGLPEAYDVFSDDRNEDIQVVLEGLEWQPSPRVQLEFTRFAIMGDEWLLARVFLDDAARYDRDGTWATQLQPMERQLRARSVPVIIQSNAAEFSLVLESTMPEVRWRGVYEAKAGDREVRVGVLPGEYRMRCVKPGHTGLTTQLEVWPGSAGIQERCLLAAESRSITIESPVPGERVRIEGKTEKFTEVPFAAQLEPGDYMALVERVQGDDVRILRIPFSVTGAEDSVVLNTTFGEMRLLCLGAPCDRNDFKVQTFEEGWLGAEQPLIQKEKDTYLLPFGNYKITLVKDGYARETHSVRIGPGELEPEIFTLRPETRGDEEEAALRAAAEEAALPNLFRYHSRLTTGADFAGETLHVVRTDEVGVDREVQRVDVNLDYVYRFKLTGKRIPFVFFDGRFGLQAGSESQTLTDLLSFEATIGGGFYQRFKSNVHAAFAGGYHLRYDDWAPDDRHLSAVGADLRGLLEYAWFQTKIEARFDYGSGRAQMPNGVTYSTNQSQALHFGAETAFDLVEAIVGDPFVDLYLGFAFSGDYVRERRDEDAKLTTFNGMTADVFLRFEWRFDIADALRWVIGAQGRFHALGPFVLEHFLSSQDKLRATPAEGRSWSAGAWIGAEF